MHTLPFIFCLFTAFSPKPARQRRHQLYIFSNLLSRAFYKSPSHHSVRCSSISWLKQSLLPSWASVFHRVGVQRAAGLSDKKSAGTMRLKCPIQKARSIAAPELVPQPLSFKCYSSSIKHQTDLLDAVRSIFTKSCYSVGTLLYQKRRKMIVLAGFASQRELALLPCSSPYIEGFWVVQLRETSSLIGVCIIVRGC